MAKPSPPSSEPVRAKDEGLLPGDRIPVPDAQEIDSDGAWEAWSQLNARQDKGFAPTRPASLSMLAEQHEPGFAPTVPAGLEASPPAAPGRPAPGRRSTSLPALLAEARWNNRVCVQEQLWRRLYDLLVAGLPPGVRKPAPPLVGPAWSLTPAMAKRMVFREHLQWAARHHRLAAVAEFLQDLGEQDWHHLGE